MLQQCKAPGDTAAVFWNKFSESETTVVNRSDTGGKGNEAGGGGAGSGDGLKKSNKKGVKSASFNRVIAKDLRFQSES